MTSLKTLRDIWPKNNYANDVTFDDVIKSSPKFFEKWFKR